MKPVSPVVPGIALPEIEFAKHQPEYLPLPAVVLDGLQGEILTRWELDDTDRARIAAGGAIYLSIWTFGQRLQPVLLSTDPPAMDVLTDEGIRTIGGPTQ